MALLGGQVERRAHGVRRRRGGGGGGGGAGGGGGGGGADADGEPPLGTWLYDVVHGKRAASLEEALPALPFPSTGLMPPMAQEPAARRCTHVASAKNGSCHIMAQARRVRSAID